MGDHYWYSKVPLLQRFGFIFLCVFLCLGQLFAEEAYEVQFEGVPNKDVLHLMKSSSQLIQLQDRPPGTNIALRRRANEDLPAFIQALHSFAYYNAKIEIDVDTDQSPALITIKVDPGNVYPLVDFRIIPSPGSTFDFWCLDYEDLYINIGMPARPATIIAAEDALLYMMAAEGYPLAIITDRKVIADQSTKTLTVTIYVDSGPLASFGETVICGNECVDDSFFFKKLAWCKGEVYDPCKVDETFHAIEASGLFSSVVISHAAEPTSDNSLPITIEVSESRHRSIGAGLSFTTQRGSGVTAEWENRNVGGRGHKFGINANIWTDTQGVGLLYVHPDFGWRAQDLVLHTDYLHEKTKGYTETSFTVGATLEQQLSACMRTSYGLMYKQLHDARSDNNGEYNLLKVPLYLRWTDVDDLLDPHYGNTLHLSAIPSGQVIDDTFLYSINTITGTTYYPLDEYGNTVLAAKGTYGSIFGTSRRNLPPSERFYAGTESLLRGYRYRTVSPLGRDKKKKKKGADAVENDDSGQVSQLIVNDGDDEKKHDDDDNKPVGGRSMLIFSLEARFRLGESFGLVPFWDFGNVYGDRTPQLSEKFLHSVGLGIRYYTPVGPLRLDVAVPLNRRKDIDDKFQVYVSVGQSF